MNTDIRLQVTFPSHPKIIKLKKTLGAEAVLCLINLWIWTAMNKPDGILSDMDSGDIAIISQWPEDVDEYTNTLVKFRLLDAIDGGFTVHDWQNNNPWASDAKSRSEKARKAAESRWKKEKE